MCPARVGTSYLFIAQSNYSTINTRSFHHTVATVERTANLFKYRHQKTIVETKTQIKQIARYQENLLILRA